MGMIQEFKEFALGGNMVDMAVGIVVGGATGKLVGDMVDHLINPIVGKFAGGVDFGAMATDLASEGAAEPLLLKWGAFISSFINFLILMFVIFIMIKMINNAKKSMNLQPPPPADPGPSEIDLLKEIRDALKK